MSEHIAGVILAGGQSRRMGGGDKSLLPLGGGLVLNHIVSRLSLQVAPLALNANRDAARFAGFELPVIADTVGGFAGPLAGILAGLEWAGNMQCQMVATVAGDTPFFPADLIGKLAAEIRAPDTIAVAISDGRRHPVFALWPVSLRNALRHFLVDEDQRRVSGFIDAQKFVEVDFPMTESNGQTMDPFFNINTPADLAEAESFLRKVMP